MTKKPTPRRGRGRPRGSRTRPKTPPPPEPSTKTHPDEVRRLGHRPSLDVLRGLAISLVLIGHFGIGGYLGAGRVGVTIFFVLSGFLITSVLLESSSDGPALVRFYRRRAVRLAPALALLLVVVGFWAQSSGRWPEYQAQWLAAALYLSNWHQIIDPTVKGALTHTWSLAVEEQFYLLWPLTLLALRRLSDARSLLCLLSLIVLSLGLRLILFGSGEYGPDRVYFGFDTNALSLLLGCLVSLMWHRGHDFVFHRRPSRHIITVALVLLIVWLATVHDKNSVILALPLVAVATAALISVELGASNWLARVPILGPLGRISYGVYLWHHALIWMCLSIPTSVPGQRLIAGTLTLLAAAASYRLMERPLLDWERRLGSRAEQ